MKARKKGKYTMMMKTTAIVCAVATAAMSFSGAAFAQDRGHHDRGGRDRHESRVESHGGHHYNRGSHAVTAPRYSRHSYVQSAPHYRTYSAPAYTWQHHRSYAPRYYGYAPAWRVGGYYNGPRYVVSNWGAYPGLYAPPYGYQWVRTDAGDFILMAIATGLIANLIAHSSF
jgi:Ni/Co efflux regulator RcnB